MTSRRLIETDVHLIKTQIQTNITQALIDVGNDRTVKIGSLQPPNEYFIYENASGFRPPCIFIIAQDVDFRLQDGQNFIDAVSRINITALLQDKLSSDLTISAWRYQAALHKILHGIHLLDSDLKVKIVIKVTRAEFSPVYTNAQANGDAQGVFRKEVLLRCDVEHYEGLT